MPHHLHQPIYTVAQIRQAEHYAIAEYGISGLQLMKRAGQAVLAAMIERWPEQRRLIVCAGSGNNAGDGYVIAKLALELGYQVRCYSLIDPLDLPADAYMCFQEYCQSGGEVFPWQAQTSLDADLLIDAVLGIGLNRAVSDEIQALLQAINAAPARRIAVDLPSGIAADSGQVLGGAVKADLTVTFIGGKAGLYTGEAVDYCGEVVIADLALPSELYQRLQPQNWRLAKLPLPKRILNAHKGHFGHVLLIGGNHGYSGAIRLAAEAALRSGAGLVSVATRARHSDYLHLVRPELMSHAVETVAALQPLLAKASVVVIGPGLGQDSWAEKLMTEVICSGKPCVLDADALNWLALHPQPKSHWILTPHPGEAARLLQCSTAAIARDRLAAVRLLQARYGGVAILKGAGSLIADGHACWISPTGNPGMASGGMGDVLAGICGSLLAQGWSLAEAAQLAVYVHGEAADHVAAQQGQRGILALDVVGQLQRCLN